MAAPRPFCLPAELRTKTDPVRQAFLAAVMTPALEAAGISFDVVNPLTAKVVSQSGSQIVGIAETTQADVMKVVQASYEQGLSIPDTAKAIRAYMAEASNVRATMIARTELAGVTNGGSLAATQIVAGETGSEYFKTWLTAPGAMHPRHENYDGLDGQTVRLDETFEVGDAQLNFPGDPEGPPEEVIQCRRCTMSYTDDASELTAAAATRAEGETVLRADERPRRAHRNPHPVSAHNDVLERAYQRVDELEPRLVAVLKPIFDRAGEIAARRFEQIATDHLTATAGRHADLAIMRALEPIELGRVLSSLALTAAANGTAADIDQASTMIAVYPRPDEAKRLAETDGEDPATMHVTLAYLGQTDEDEARRLAQALTTVAGTHPPLAGKVGGVGAFDDQGNGVPAILLPDVPGLVELRQAACEAILAADGDYSRDHGYTPHATVAYRDGGAEPPDRTSLGQPLHFDSLYLVRGNQVIAELPLTGAPALTAAGPPDWTPPSGEELLPIRCEAPVATQGGLAAGSDVSTIAAQMVERAAELEPATTAELSQIADEIGGKMAGLEFNVKSRTSLERKIAGDLAKAQLLDPSATLTDVAGTVNDTLRYTMTLPNATYGGGVRDAIVQLEQAGYREVTLKNYWGNADYEGINGVFEKGGYLFEVQFHTPQTFALKSKLHTQYEAFRVSTDSAEQQRLWDEMAAEYADLLPPPGSLTIGQLRTHAPPT